MMKSLHHHAGIPRSALLPFLLLLGCGGEPAGADMRPAQALRLRFPDQAGAVLAADEGEGFGSTQEGFALEGAPRGVEITLPRDGRGVTRVRDRSGFEVQVRELGAEGEGAVAERSVAYPRSGGTSFWTATEGGVEEWLHLDAGAARKGEPLAVWEVEGATVRTRGEGADLVDAGGMARISVTAPVAYTAGGRPIRAWMAGRASRLELWVEPEEEAVLVDPLWTSAKPMATARLEHTATLLPSGKVLVVGGKGDGVALDSAELYDPTTDTWEPTANKLTNARYSHIAVLLKDGKVLVAGGQQQNSGTPLASSELYDPATNTWQQLAAKLTISRYYATATLLPSGKVLLVGGYHGGPKCLDSAELYDPATNIWDDATSLTNVRDLHTATRLSDGKVLVVGGKPGTTGDYLKSAELYDPATTPPTTPWKSAGSLAIGRDWHTATLLPNDQVLVVGGQELVGNGGSGDGGPDGGPGDGGTSKEVVLDSAELYNPATKTWKPAASLTSARYEHTATLLLKSGRVLVVGGRGDGDTLASAELYDPATSDWKPTISLNSGRDLHTATLLPSGKVLVVGGEDKMGAPLASAELYTPCASSADCHDVVNRECQVGFCDLPTSACIAINALDGVPCKVGMCIAGGCHREAGSSASSGSTGVSSGASAGSGAEPSASSGGTTATGAGPSANSAGASGGTTVTGAGPSANNAGAGGSTGEAGAGGSPGEIRLRGGACGLTRGAAEGAPWLGLGLGLGLTLLHVRRRR